MKEGLLRTCNVPLALSRARHGIDGPKQLRHIGDDHEASGEHHLVTRLGVVHDLMPEDPEVLQR